MAFHADTPALERHALHFEPQPLFESVLTRYANRATRADHPVPRQIAKHPQGPRYLPRGARETSRGGDLSVACNPASRNLADNPRESD